MIIKNRISSLDGLRGLAILLVILFHAFARWPHIVPYGPRFAEIPFFANGWLGVELFFLISGFVILMTLEKCHNFWEFMLRRWLRLFPAMLVCSSLIFASQFLFPERPSGISKWADILPGLTFLNSSWWGAVLGEQPNLLEGSFWSLLVEVKFYILFGGLYFLVGWRKAISVLLALFLLTNIFFACKEVAPTVTIHGVWRIADDAKYYGWFAAGALYYEYTRNGERKHLLSAILIALLSAVTVHEFEWKAMPCAIGIVLLFTTAIVSKKLCVLWEHPFFIFLGFVSYPLYLLHENMMISMIVKVGHFAPWMPDILMPIIPVIIIIGLSWCVVRFAEPYIKGVIKSFFQKIIKMNPKQQCGKTS